MQILLIKPANSKKKPWKIPGNIFIYFFINNIIINFNKGGGIENNETPKIAAEREAVYFN